MAGLYENITSWYTYIMDDLADPRVKDWPLMSNPFPTILICLTYVYCVKRLGPRLMENRKPFQVRKSIILYNALQVIFSIWLFREALYAGWGWGRYSLGCVSVDYSTTPLALREASGCWWYFISKFSEFLDTFFFVLRKKSNHVSKLHVIHHGIMPFSVWWGVKYTPGGHASFFGLLNVFVHIIMYSYYLLAAMGDRFKPYLWWKRYLTRLQMVQFIAVALHSINLLYLGCEGSKALMAFIMAHALLFLVLFSEFYSQAYSKDKSKKTIKETKVSESDSINVSENGKTNLVNGHVDDSLHKDYTTVISGNGLKHRAFEPSNQNN